MATLLRDPSSWLQASIAGWDFPVTREWIVGAHTYDLLHAVNSKKTPKPYPTPWPNENTKRLGRSNRPTNEVLAQLERMNPKENDG